MTHRIALLFEYPTLNGGERSMLQALDLVDRRAFEIIALAPPHGRLAEALRDSSVKHVNFELRDDHGERFSRDAARETLVETIRDLAPDLLHANSLSMGRLTGAAADALRIPCVAHLRDIIRLSRAAIDDLNRNDLLVAVSHATREFHIAQKVSDARTRVLFNGVDSERFQPRARTHSLCRELKVPCTSFVVLTIGQLGLRKGQDVLAASAATIAKAVPNVQFVIVGERNSSKQESILYEANVKTAFSDAGLDQRLHLLGYREDVPRLMNEADLLVHPAKQEPLGRVLLEAAASGLPIVATGVGGTREIVADSESARLIAPNAPNALASAVIELASDRQLRERFSAAARQRVCQSFTPRAAADGLMGIWRGA